MALYLFRHAEAFQIGEEGIKTDEERFLTPKGKKVTVDVCTGLKDLDVGFDEVWFSPLVRAKETADIIVEEMGVTRSKEKRGLAYTSDERELFAKLADHSVDQHLCLVGHQPTLGEWVSLLISGLVGEVALSKSGVARIDVFPHSEPPRGELRWLLTAKQIRRLR